MKNKRQIIEDNSFENPMSREVADEIIQELQEKYLDVHDGRRVELESSFQVAGQEYSFVTFGVATNIGEGVILHCVFVKED